MQALQSWRKKRNGERIKIFDIVSFLQNIMLSRIRIVGIIHLVRTQNFPKNHNFFPPDTHARTSTSQGVRNVTFSENFAYAPNEWSLTVEI